jgi:hypothetical protein
MRLELYSVNNLNFVEFNVTGDMETFQQCDKDSLYMDTELFNLFAECFEASNNLYDYFGPTKYNARHIVILLNELNAFLIRLGQIDTYINFIDFSGSKFLGSGFVIELDKLDKNWSLNWEEYKSKLIQINRELINLVNACIEKDKILWVIGY